MTICFLRAFSRAVGYWPAQGMDRQLSAVLDLMLPGSGKQLSRENELLVAVQRVLFATTQALRSWKARRSSHTFHFDATPLILVSGFTSENKDRRPGFFEALVSWAAYVTEAKLARVVFVADSSFGEASILGHLKDRPERLSVFQVQDVQEACVRNILKQHLGDLDISDISDQQLRAIGGRYMDISAMLGHMRHGVAASEAVRLAAGNCRGHSEAAAAHGPAQCPLDSAAAVACDLSAGVVRPKSALRCGALERLPR